MYSKQARAARWRSLPTLRGLALAGLLFAPVIDAVALEVEGLLVVTQCDGVSTGQWKESARPAAERCARAGVPLAVKSKRGTFYTVAAPSPLLASHIARRVRLSGEEIAPRVVIPDKLEVETESGWREVPTTSMM